MSHRLLPTGEAFEKLKEQYPTASLEWLAEMAKALGFANVESFERSMATFGVRRQVNIGFPSIKQEPVILAAPEIKIKPIKQEGKRGQGDEVHLQLISDCHCGLLTPSYNVQVFKERLEKLKQTMVNICLLHRKMRPIRKLVVPFLGDQVQGEQYGRQGYVEEYEIGAVEQIYDVLVPEFTNFFVNLLQVYPSIEIYGVEGNHGNIQPRSQTISKRSNWDIVFYRALKEALVKYSRITINTQEAGAQPYQVIEVNGWKFLLIHGDLIISYMGIPYYGLERKEMRWKQSIGVAQPFDFGLFGHFHNPNFLWNNGIPTYINGSFSTDSRFPLMRMGLKDVPKQYSLFVNRKWGVTATYLIDLERS